MGNAMSVLTQEERDSINSQDYVTLYDKEEEIMEKEDNKVEIRTLQIGDVVKLKSGSCLMTVDNIFDGCVECVWFNDKEDLFSGPFIHRFSKHSLVLVY